MIKKSLTWEDYFILSSLYLKDKDFKNIENYSRKILEKLRPRDLHIIILEVICLILKD